ncbi:MAG TPA: hypothetical protein VFK88_08420 [Gallionella sp.]|nr:hypothetical protein [Gallionella sp.]
MMPKQSYTLILSAMVLTACGGGGGASAGSAPSLVKPVADVRLSANTTRTWSSIVQAADYGFDPAAAPTIRVATMNVRPVDTQTGSTTISTGAVYPGDATLGQTIAITNTLATVNYWLGQIPGSTVIPSTLRPNAIAPGLSSVSLVAQVNPTTVLVVEYALPYSASLSPAGFTYQTFGYWSTLDSSTLANSEYYFSTGVQADPATLPVSGTATYNGLTYGTFVDATTGDLSDVTATMNATANFATLSVAFSTTGTTARSWNAAAGTAPVANSNLDMNGTLSYAAGNNTFTGTVATVNGMSGNATGRFYGPGIVSATATKVSGAPAEIGGTFAVTGAAGAMQGAFAGK